MLLLRFHGVGLLFGDLDSFRGEVAHLPSNEVFLGRPASCKHHHPGVAGGSHRPTRSLGALSPGPAQTRGDDGEFGVWEVDTLVADAGDDQRVLFAPAERVEEAFVLGVAPLTPDEGDVDLP